MSKINNAGIQIIKESESLRLKAYKCPAGVWTIGYGHTLNVKEGDEISEAQADEFLIQDIARIEPFVQGLGLNDNQASAILSFIFKLGIGNFSHSTLKKKILAIPNDHAIAHEFKRWVYGGGKVSPG